MGGSTSFNPRHLLTYFTKSPHTEKTANTKGNNAHIYMFLTIAIPSPSFLAFIKLMCGYNWCAITLIKLFKHSYDY